MEKKEWFKKNVRYLKILNVEKELGCGRGTLDKWLKGERELPEKWCIALDKFVDDFHFGLGVSEPNIREVFSKSVEIAFEQDSPKFNKEVKVLDKAVREDGYTVPKPMIGGIANPSDHFELTKVKEKKSKISIPVDMSNVDVTTGEIKEKLEPIRIKWLFSKVEASYEVVEPWISKSGNLYEVKRMFGSIAKYVYVNNLEDARRIVEAKNPLLVELSVK